MKERQWKTCSKQENDKDVDRHSDTERPVC